EERPAAGQGRPGLRLRASCHRPGRHRGAVGDSRLRRDRSGPIRRAGPGRPQAAGSPPAAHEPGAMRLNAANRAFTAIVVVAAATFGLFAATVCWIFSMLLYRLATVGWV